LFSDVLPSDINEKITIYSWVTIFGTLFKKGMCVAVTYNEDSLPVFGEIQFVIYCKKLKNVFFILTMFHTITYNKHFSCYEVHNTFDWKFILMILSQICLFIAELEPEVHPHILRFVIC